MNERIFTGCYDANGTPIYTGDILKWTNDDKQNRLIAVTVKDGVFYGGEEELSEVVKLEPVVFGRVLDKRTESE